MATLEFEKRRHQGRRRNKQAIVPSIARINKHTLAQYTYAMHRNRN